MIAIELSALDRTGRTFVATNNQMMLKPLILSGMGVAFFTPLGLLEELRSGRCGRRSRLPARASKDWKSAWSSPATVR